MRTNIDSIYAIGDVTGLYELAHVASKQGEVAAENLMGRAESTIDYASLCCISRRIKRKLWGISANSMCEGKLYGRDKRISQGF